MDTMKRRTERRLSPYFLTHLPVRIQHPFCSLFLFSMFMFFMIVAAVTERLVLRLATSAKSNLIANFVGFSICRFDRDAAVHPQRAAHPCPWIFDGND